MLTTYICIYSYSHKSKSAHWVTVREVPSTLSVSTNTGTDICKRTRAGRRSAKMGAAKKSKYAHQSHRTHLQVFPFVAALSLHESTAWKQAFLTMAQFAGKFTWERGFLRCTLHTHGRGLGFFKAFQGFSRLLSNSTISIWSMKGSVQLQATTMTWSESVVFESPWLVSRGQLPPIQLGGCRAAHKMYTGTH